VNQDFTSDRDLLRKSAVRISISEPGEDSTKAVRNDRGHRRNGGSFTVDDTEYNIFNTDRRLQALRSIADKLSRIDEKKSLIYFSSGMDRTGHREPVPAAFRNNAAVRANMAIYTMDIRGLQALVPGGEAQNASLRGTSPTRANPCERVPPQRDHQEIVTLAVTPAGALSSIERLR